MPSRLLVVAANIRRENIKRNLLLANELCLVTAAFEQSKIPVIAFKGPVAAMQFHGGLDSRPCGDLDLLVPEAAFRQAEAVVKSAGYEKFAEHPEAFQACYQNARRTHSIDLHWSIPPGDIEIGISSLWQSARPMKVLDRSILTFSDQDSIVIAAVNAMKEYWNVTLHQFVDLAAALDRLSPDAWEQAIERSRSLNARRALLNAGVVYHELFRGGTGVADSGSAFVRDGDHRPAVEVLNQLFRPLGDRRALHTLPCTQDYFLLLQDRLSSRVRSRTTRFVRGLRRRWGALRRRLGAAPRRRSAAPL